MIDINLTVLGLFSLIILAIWLKRRRVPPVWLGRFTLGTVYIFQDRQNPGLIKVGVTSRLCKTRKTEVSRTMADGGDLRQVYALDHMPFPMAVERLAHGFLRHSRVYWPKGSSRGVEWFRIRDEGGIDRAISAVEKAAWTVRTAARRKKRWPTKADASVSVWRLVERKVVRYFLFDRDSRTR
jgi:hypothetical protein